MDYSKKICFNFLQKFSSVVSVVICKTILTGAKLVHNKYEYNVSFVQKLIEENKHIM